MNILLSSVGRRSYLVEYFKEALHGKGKVVATNSMAETTGMLSADIAEIVPPATDPRFIDFMLDVCRRHEVKLLCSLHDWEAPQLAVHKHRFTERGIIPIIPEADMVDTCLDKYKTSQFANATGVPAPACYINLDDALAALQAKAITFPLILKPRWGQGSIAIKKVRNKNELILAYSLIHTELIERKMEYLAGEKSTQQILIQQFIDGKEYGVDIVNDLNGDPAACFVKYKLAMRAGETDVAETVHMPKIEKYANKIAKASGHPGNMDADFIVSENGTTYLLELNPRFGGGYPFSHLAGANIPAALIAWAQGGRPVPSDLKVKEGVRGFKEITIIQA